MTDKLRVAIAGCHRMLDTLNRGHNWANGFARVPETTVMAVFDKGQETRDEFREVWRETWGEIPGYDDYDKMLAETRPDIVCVTTRQTMHADQIEAAVAAGVRGIACEKPLAPSLEDADRILAACTSKGVPLAYLLDRRWTAKQRATRSLIRGGAIGDVTSVVGYGASNLINHGCHWYDMALALAGDAEPVWTSGEVIDVSGDPPDSRRPMDPPGRSITQLANGSVVQTLPDGAGLSFHVTGTEGGLLARGDFTSVQYWRDGEDGQAELEMPSDEVEWPAGPDAVGDLVDAVVNGGTTACDVDEARRATEIGFAVHLSHQAGGARVSLPAADRGLRVESFPWGNE